MITPLFEMAAVLATVCVMLPTMTGAAAPMSPRLAIAKDADAPLAEIEADAPFPVMSPTAIDVLSAIETVCPFVTSWPTVPKVVAAMVDVEIVDRLTLAVAPRAPMEAELASPVRFPAVIDVAVVASMDTAPVLSMFWAIFPNSPPSKLLLPIDEAETDAETPVAEMPTEADRPPRAPTTIVESSTLTVAEFDRSLPEPWVIAPTVPPVNAVEAIEVEDTELDRPVAEIRADDAMPSRPPPLAAVPSNDVEIDASVTVTDPVFVPDTSTVPNDPPVKDVVSPIDISDTEVLAPVDATVSEPATEAAVIP